MVNGKQLTVTWHVDDLKASHADDKVLEEFIQWVRDMYEDPEIGKVKGGISKHHDYLAMNLDYSTPGVVKIRMTDYVEKMLSGFEYQDEIKGTAATPAAEHLFDISDDEPLLEQAKAEVFHTYVAKALFLCKRARPDIQLAVAFLCTQVQAPTDHDWKKLLRLMKYLRKTKDLYLTLSADGSLRLHGTLMQRLLCTKISKAILVAR